MIDGHAHLDEVEDLSKALLEARRTGVVAIIAVGMEVESNEKVLNIAEENRGYVYPALGYHPWKIREESVDANLSFIRGRVKECVALGEIGLDYKVKIKKELTNRLSSIAVSPISGLWRW
jgi:TatD DNase family protein